MLRSPVERSHLARSWDGGLRVDTVIRINLHRTRSARGVLPGQWLAGDGAGLWRDGRTTSVEDKLVFCLALPASWRDERPQDDGNGKRDDALVPGLSRRSAGNFSGRHREKRAHA